MKMAIVMVSNIRKDAHLADVACCGGEKSGLPCNYSEADWNVNTDMAYGKKMDGSDNKDFVVVTCPNCAMTSTYPTTDEKNSAGFALGQAKTA
jgi:predicted nucleic-acid-binding Zn-ribbon protein